jgi:hypothetical protein
MKPSQGSAQAIYAVKPAVLRHMDSWKTVANRNTLSTEKLTRHFSLGLPLIND